MEEGEGTRQYEITHHRKDPKVLTLQEEDDFVTIASQRNRPITKLDLSKKKGIDEYAFGVGLVVLSRGKILTRLQHLNISNIEFTTKCFGVERLASLQVLEVHSSFFGTFYL